MTLYDEDGNELLVDGQGNPEDVKIFDNKWMSVYETPDGFVYGSQPVTKSQGVIVLIYHTAEDGETYVVGMYEDNPAHGDWKPVLYSLTGGVKDKHWMDTAIEEIREEAGIEANPKKLYYLGEASPSKAASILYFVYIYNQEELKPLEGTGDGSLHEENDYPRWVTLTHAAQSCDPLLHTAILRGVAGGYFELNVTHEITEEMEEKLRQINGD